MAIAEALEANGWAVWWDRRIPPGKIFAQVIKEALDAAESNVNRALRRLQTKEEREAFRAAIAATEAQSLEVDIAWR